jgi:hypothetical protein
MREHNFSPAVVKEIAQKAMYICSNPACLCLTGYATSEGKARSIAEGAHILPASNKGPRATNKSSHSTIDPRSSKNGIWLCKICHDKVDDDETYYTPDVLFEWKKNHEEVIRRIVGKDLEAALLDLRNHKRYHEETRELISFFESKRVLYVGLDKEFPPRVLESLEIIRERIVQTRAKVNPDTDLFLALNNLQKAINRFLRDIGTDTDLMTLRCDNSNPAWVRFAAELEKLRAGILIIIKVLSGEANYKATWF